jgi:tetratricopeptide (TPR) repeat protein
LSSTRRSFLHSLSRSALVLPLEKILSLALPRKPSHSALSQAAAHAPSPTAAPANDLGIAFLNVARESGLNAKTIFGGEHKNKYLLETTGCGVAFYDYDNDGWLDIFLVNGWRLEGFPSGQEPTNHLFKNNRDGTFTDVTAKAGLVHSGWGQGVCVGDYDNDGFDDLFITYFGKNVLYHNNGNGTFTDVSEKSGILNANGTYGLGVRPTEAMGPLERVQTWYPRANVDAAYILGVCYMQTKDYPSARKAFAKMFAVPADSAASYLFTARMLLRQDFGPVAEEYAKKAVELDPKLPLAHSLLGEIYLYKSRLPEAIEQFQKELELNPGEAAVYYKLADAYSRLQKYEEAERLLQRSIWLDATSTGPYILMGKILEKKGETALAVRALQRALAMDPNNPMPHHLLGQAYRELGRTEEADRELKLAEQLQIHQNAKP